MRWRFIFQNDKSQKYEFLIQYISFSIIWLGIFLNPCFSIYCMHVLAKSMYRLRGYASDIIYIVFFWGGGSKFFYIFIWSWCNNPLISTKLINLRVFLFLDSPGVLEKFGKWLEKENCQWRQLSFSNKVSFPNFLINLRRFPVGVFDITETLRETRFKHSAL